MAGIAINHGNMKESVQFTIRKSTMKDLALMQEVFAEAKQKMRAAGNMRQWTGSYPSDIILADDIERGFSYVIETGGNIVATFVLAECIEPTYDKIYEGTWLNDTLPYATIHRIASRNGYHGIMDLALNFAFSRIDNIRIDTHRDNTPMRYLIEKHNFTYCGIIYLKSGDERLAYQRVIHNS